MNLKQSRRKNGRVYLTIEKAYRDANGKPRTKTIKSLGYLDELEKIYDDPIAHFKEVARRMTEEEKASQNVTMVVNMNEELEPSTDSRKNFGYAAILKIYHELKLDRFFKNKARHKKFEYNTNSIMMLLVISRILSPGSKKKAYEEKGRYFERFDFSLTHVYRALSHFSEIATDFQRYLHSQISNTYGRNTIPRLSITTLPTTISKLMRPTISGSLETAKKVVITPLYNWDWPWTQTEFLYATNCSQATL